MCTCAHAGGIAPRKPVPPAPEVVMSGRERVKAAQDKGRLKENAGK